MRISYPGMPCVQDESLEYRAPRTLSESPHILSSLVTLSIPQLDTCPICLEGESHRWVKIIDCGHSFHFGCIRDSLKARPVCPLCFQNVGPPQGCCPSGTMFIEPTERVCPGFEPRITTIMIRYVIPSGIQADYHENPGMRFEGINRVAFIPNNQEGVQLLCRLKVAWSLGLIFCVGTSLTTGRKDRVVWSSVHHKTTLLGGTHGFPDATYIMRCNDELTKIGVSTTIVRSSAICESIPYTAPESLISDSAIDKALESTGISSPTTGWSTPRVQSWYLNGCCACERMLTTSACVRIKECGHYVHHSCISERLNRNDQTCPQCNKAFGEPQGRSPSGTMTIKATNELCPGLSEKLIEIWYYFPSGEQLEYHQRPGVRYPENMRPAYLPQTSKGCQLLKRLKYAWLHGLTFDIGFSQTYGMNDRVIWNGIPHKTSLKDGHQYGFPDPSYLNECNKILDKMRVPKANACR